MAMPFPGVGSILMALALGLTACGGGSSNDESPSPPAPAPSPAFQASECFNPVLYGSRLLDYQFDYRISGARQGTYVKLGLNYKSSPQDPRPANIFEDHVTTQYDGEANASKTITNTTYLTSGVEVSVSRQDTTYSSPTPGVIPRTLTVFNPPRKDQRFTLAPGGSFNLVSNFTRTDWTSEERVASGFTDTGGRTQIGTLQTLVSYVGQESVVVPGGTYQACRFEETLGNTSTTVWYAKQSGQIVKQTTNAAGVQTVLELTQSRIGF